jgi:D-glucuronyl C5-epimerase C-terminus
LQLPPPEIHLRTLGMVRRMLFSLLAAALLTGAWALPSSASAADASVLVLDHGRVTARHDAFLTPPDSIRPTAADAVRARRGATVPRRPGQATAAAKRLTIAGALKGMYARHGITRTAYGSYKKIYADARASLRKLTGRRRSELAAVIGNLSSLAARGDLVSGRAPLSFLTLKRNRDWWTTGRLLNYGERVEFGKSIVQWQSYPGQGIQLQWLGTFGKVNALWSAGTKYKKQLKALIAEILPLATARAGGIAWEYQFRFDGGSPPWVSGMAQGTAIQGLSRASKRLGKPSYLKIAHSALGIFKTSYPRGVRLRTKAGAHYLLYSFAPGARVLNGFIQALNGLHDYYVAASDKTAKTLFLQGQRQARLEVPRIDTGAWSLYQLGGEESDLSYHTLLRDFLKGLCTRLTDDRKRSKRPSSLPSPARYCSAQKRFTTYLHQAPKISLRAVAGARVGRYARVRVHVSKISTVTLSVSRGGGVVSSQSLALAHGTHTLSWGPVAKKGPVTLTVRASDLAGNAGSKSGRQTVR